MINMLPVNTSVNPRLLGLSGPLRDSVFALPGSEVPVGRDPGNLLAIPDPSLSRRHCIILPADSGFLIRDLDSRNGTYVNGVAIKEGSLQHGDQISVGDSVFILLIRDDAHGTSEAGVEFEDGPAQATAQVRPQDVLYLQPDRILGELPSSSRVTRNLNALLKISRIVHQIHDLEKLQSQILELMFEVAPAERGAILLDGQGEKFASVFARHRASASAHPVRVSRTIARKVVIEGVAVLGTDVLRNDGLNSVESLLVSNVRSLLCVPLIVFQKVTGCIYLDTTNSSARFDDDHLQLVTAVAGICAVALENARRLRDLEQENLRLATKIHLEHNMVGESPRLKQTCSLISKVAPTDSTVLIEGESGTGKELAARALHRSSPRHDRQFVAINCAAIPEELLESELFGHERGAFTNAVTQKKGRLELANGGTVFLDEIGEMAPKLQVKLLRVLQEREFERIGGIGTIKVDVRIIAATNKDLAASVKAGEFRRDLYYRLNVVSVVMPPLRERRPDIPLLAGHFVEKYSQKFAIKPKRISPEAMACLMNYSWPGNVRELENAIERALVLGSSDLLHPEDLPEAVVTKDISAGVTGAKYHAALIDLKKHLILKALEETKGNYTDAARLLGLHVNYLHRLIRNLGLREQM
jgi:transcriptional regulator with GAF, ATPase, and Fis domain